MWIKTALPSNKKSYYRCTTCGRYLEILPMFFCPKGTYDDYEWAYVCSSDSGGCGAVFDVDEVNHV